MSQRFTRRKKSPGLQKIKVPTHGACRLVRDAHASACMNKSTRDHHRVTAATGASLEALHDQAHMRISHQQGRWSENMYRRVCNTCFQPRKTAPHFRIFVHARRKLPSHGYLRHNHTQMPTRRHSPLPDGRCRGPRLHSAP
jgi:hypothetical protein